MFRGRIQRSAFEVIMRGAMVFLLLLLTCVAGQQPPVAPIASGSVAGRVNWSDGAPAVGITVSAIATTSEGLPPTWVMGNKLAGSAVTDSNGAYRIENLPAGLYHIVTGPVYLPRSFSDVSLSGSSHLVQVTNGKTAGDVLFTCVRYVDVAGADPNRTLTVTGKLVWASFGGPSGPVVLLNTADGGVSYWQFRGVDGNAMYWWPGLDAAKDGVLQKMYKDGEVITISGGTTTL